MRNEVEREVVLDAEPDEVWRELTESDWLGEDTHIELEPGGELELVDRIDGPRTGWVEQVEPGERLVVWWAAEGEEESSRVEFCLEPVEAGTALRVVESRPLSDLTVPTALALA